MKLLIEFADLTHTLKFYENDSNNAFASIEVFSGGRTLLGFARQLLVKKVVDEINIIRTPDADIGMSDKELSTIDEIMRGLSDMSK